MGRRVKPLRLDLASVSRRQFDDSSTHLLFTSKLRLFPRVSFSVEMTPLASLFLNGQDSLKLQEHFQSANKILLDAMEREMTSKSRRKV